MRTFPIRWSRRRFLPLVALTVALLASSASVRIAHAQSDPATRALRYLNTQQLADGSIPSSFPSYSPSEDYAIGAAAAGYDPNLLRNGGCATVMTYLSGHAADASSSAGPAGKLLQAVVAARLSPTSFGGVNLLAVLAADYKSTTGTYGDGQAFTQTLAIQGLAAAGQPVPPKAVTSLTSAQDTDGGWNYLDQKDNAAGSDTNSTAMTLMALAAVGDHSRDVAALVWLRKQQQSDGGFPYQQGQGSDPDSDALVIQALVATSQNPDAPPWSSGTNNADTHLLSQQQPDGGFGFQSPVSDPFTTSPTPVGLEHAPYPVSGRFIAGTLLVVPTRSCTAAAAPPPSQVTVHSVPPTEPGASASVSALASGSASASASGSGSAPVPDTGGLAGTRLGLALLLVVGGLLGMIRSRTARRTADS